MKKCFSIFLFFFSLLLASLAFAVQTTTLTSYYPPPKAAYNKIQLATNATIPSTTAANYCTSSNIGAPFFTSIFDQIDKCTGTGAYIRSNCNNFPGIIYYDNSTGFPFSGNLVECSTSSGPLKFCSIFCSEPGNPVPGCTSANTGTYINNGAVLADSNGILHVCMSGNGGIPTDTIYPQECFNKFCSHSTYDGDNSNGTNVCLPTACPAGFTQQTPIDSQSTNYDTYDVFNPSTNTTVISYVCCSGYVNNTTAPSATISLLQVTVQGAPSPWDSIPTVKGPGGWSGVVTNAVFPNFKLTSILAGTYWVWMHINGHSVNSYFTVPNPPNSSPITITVDASKLGS